LLIWIVFSPTSVIIAAVLASITSIRRIRLWSSVVFVSAVASWFGLASLHYLGTAQ
jgi:NADH:ubiquinone oxidoreductase subunit 3 (subunit A)